MSTSTRKIRHSGTSQYYTGTLKGVTTHHKLPICRGKPKPVPAFYQQWLSFPNGQSILDTSMKPRSLETSYLQVIPVLEQAGIELNENAAQLVQLAKVNNFPYNQPVETFIDALTSSIFEENLLKNFLNTNIFAGCTKDFITNLKNIAALFLMFNVYDFAEQTINGCLKLDSKTKVCKQYARDTLAVLKYIITKWHNSLQRGETGGSAIGVHNYPPAFTYGAYTVGKDTLPGIMWFSTSTTTPPVSLIINEYTLGNALHRMQQVGYVADLKLSIGDIVFFEPPNTADGSANLSVGVVSPGGLFDKEGTAVAVRRPVYGKPYYTDPSAEDPYDLVASIPISDMRGMRVECPEKSVFQQAIEELNQGR
jgi:hypothetical protein